MRWASAVLYGWVTAPDYGRKLIKTHRMESGFQAADPIRPNELTSHPAQAFLFLFGVLLRGYVVVIAGMCALLALWKDFPWPMRAVFAVVALARYYPVVMTWLIVGR